MIVKNNKKYIQFLSGILLEGKSETIMNKIGLSKYLADDMESRYGKYAIWVADSYRKYITKLLLNNRIEFDNQELSGKGDIDNLFKSENEDFQIFLSSWWQGKYRDELYGFVFDWLRGRNSGAVVETDKLDFKNMTAIQAYTRAADWHRKLETAQAGEIKDEHGDIIMTFPDGYYWIDLESSRCDDEAKAMNHCGISGSKGSKLYSLRKDKQPSVTVELNDGTIKQIRGRANSKPKKEYHKYILDFILSDLVKSFNYDGYKSENNFYVTDLESEKDIDNIISKKPSLMKNQELNKINKNQTEELLKNTPEIFPINDIISGDLSEENIGNQIGIIFNGSNFNQFQLRKVLEAFRKSGEYFSKILIKTIKNNDLIFTFLMSNLNSGEDSNKSKMMIKMLVEKHPELKDYIKNLLLNNKDLINIYSKDSKSVLKYLDIICLKSIFDKEGLIKALEILESPKIKEVTIKETGLDYYKALISLIKDEVGSK
jgi:hypothetical protein